MRKICAKFVPRVLREDQKEIRCRDSKEMVELINSDLVFLDALVTCDGSWIYFYDPETKRQCSQWKHIGSPRPKKARQSKSTHKLLMIPFFLQYWHELHALGSQWTDNQQGILCWGLREFRKRFRRKRPTFFKSGQCHFHQDNAPVHKSILVTDYLTKMGIKTVSQPPYSRDLAPCDFWLFPKLKEKLVTDYLTKIVQTLLPVTFGYSLSPETIVMRQLRRWKRLWGRSLTRSHKRTSIGPSWSCWNGTTSALQQEEITSKGTRVSCV